MKLGADEKVKLIEIAKKLLEDNSSLNNSQIRKYASLAMQADCYEEFENYLKYQIGRASNYDDVEFLKKVLKEIMEIKKSEAEDSKCLSKIAYLFGVMAREKQYKEKIKKN